MDKAKVIIPKKEGKYLYEKELTAAYLLASFFDKNIEILPKTQLKSPDFLIGNQIWELKSPIGSGKSNIQHTLQRASKQSENIIFDARHSKIDTRRLKSELTRQFQTIRSIKRLILIEKNNKVIEILRKKC